jgi:hypothetical protein
MMYYVYELVDPRNDSVFYVGKGSGNRAYQHEQNVRTGQPSYRKSNPKLFNKIAKILAADLTVGIRIVDSFQDEDAALSREKEQIAHYGLDKLCNLTEGGVGGDTFTNSLGKDEKRQHMRESWTNDRMAKHKEVAREHWRGNGNPMRRKEARQRLSTNNPMKKQEVINKRSGQLHHNAKLTWPQVNDIRQRFEAKQNTKTELAKMYDITIQQVSAIVSYKQWRQPCASL